MSASAVLWTGSNRDGFAAASAVAPGQRLMASIGGPLSDPDDLSLARPHRDRISNLLTHQCLGKG